MNLPSLDAPSVPRKTPAYRRSLLSSLLITAALPVYADGGIEHLVISGHRSGFLRQAASAGEGHVGLQQLEFLPLQRVGEILETVPGLIVSQHSGEGKANQYYLRGFNLDHGTDFATSVNGVPVNLRTHGHGQGYTDVNFLMPELVGALDFRKGSYRGSDGDFSAAGSANLLYGYLPDAAFGVTLGEHAHQRLFAGKHWHTDEQSFIAAGAIERDDGPWQREQELKKTQAYFAWQQGAHPDGWQLELMHYQGEWNATDQIPLRAVRSGALSRYGVVDGSDGGEARRNSIGWRWQQVEQSASQTLSTQAQVYAIDYRMKLWSNFTYFLNDPERGDQFEQADARKIYGGQWSQQLEQGRTRWHWGLDWRRDDIGEVGLHLSQHRQRYQRVREDAVREDSLAAFAELDQQWNNWLRSVFALRADYFQAAVNSDRAQNSGDADDQLLSPRFSLIAAPAKNWQTYLNIGRGFHSNDARGVTTTIDPKDGETPLDPVDLLVAADNRDLGVVWQEKNLQLSASLFQLDIDSELLFIGDGGNTEATRPSRRRGLELAAYWQISANWLVDFAYAKARARFRDDADEGAYIPGSPESVAGAGLSYTGNSYYASLRWRHFGARALIEDNSERSAATSVLNFSAGWHLSRDWTLSMSVLNVLDSEDNGIAYFYESRLRDETEAVADQHIHPVEPRNVRISVAGKW